MLTSNRDNTRRYIRYLTKVKTTVFERRVSARDNDCIGMELHFTFSIGATVPEVLLITVHRILTGWATVF